MNISIVVAMAENRVIGVNNTLPWRLPEDLKYFKKITMGHPIVMGRKTFESIGRPLPGRLNIVVSRQKAWSAEGVEVVNSLDAGFELAESYARKNALDQVMLIGGAQLYEQALPKCTRLYLTEVHAKVAGDAFFPEFIRDEWQQHSCQRFEADSKNPYAYSFKVLEKKTAS